MTDLNLHTELRNSGVRLSSELRKYAKMNLTTEQWRFVFDFFQLSLKEIEQDYKENNLLNTDNHE
jgi:hypothetical protein